MVPKAIEDITRLLPERVHTFTGSDYPLPVAQTFLGNQSVDLERIRRALRDRADDDPKTVLAPVLIAAEQCEAASPDKEEYFLNDRTVQSLVFTGSKWRAGWALVLGDRKHEETVELLKARDFMVFTDRPGIEGTTYVGNRDTSLIYFLQLMVRYGLVWGRISPGDDHQMGHFLEEDMPGFLAITEDLPPLKYLIALGLMKLGAPAIVPPSFPFPYGNRVVAETPDEIVEKGSRFPNLRQRYFRAEVVQLPSFCNPAWVSEKFETASVVGGDACSFLCVRPVQEIRRKLTVVGQRGGSIGIVVEIADEGFTDDLALFVEGHALKALSYLKGVRASRSDGPFSLALADGASPSDAQIADALYWGIRVRLPGLERIGVTLIYDETAREHEAAAVRAYTENRRRAVEGMTEANTETFCVCTECRPFSLGHTCIATPEREPMCATRTYASIKAAALYDSADVPWKRRNERDLPMRAVIHKGRLLDAARGEYEGCNEAYSRMTDGRLRRVFLHSLRDHPHTSCGCFQTLAFWIPEVAGIGIMLRGSRAVAPGGRTWASMANQAGGKQAPGITGLSIHYIRSPSFLRGDGGICNLVWVDSVLHGKICDLFPPGQRVATEKDVADVESLRRFVSR